ncbi:MAG: YdcF family protein [Lysobacterales bacterium]
MNSHETREAIGQFLFVSDVAQPVDLAIVAASPSVSSILPAVELYKAGLTQRIVISGANTMTNGQLEWQGYRDHALELGVAKADLITEKRATNTKENIVFSAELIASTDTGWSNIQSIALCAKPFHMRRVLMTARHHLPKGLQLVALPPNHAGDISRTTWWKSESGRTRVLEELGRISTYALKGDIGGF